jgi:hypothetical protein
MAGLPSPPHLTAPQHQEGNGSPRWGRDAVVHWPARPDRRPPIGLGPSLVRYWPMSIISRIGSSPGVRRLARRPEAPGEVRESPDNEDRDPLWCAGCRREVLFDGLQCRHCGGQPMSLTELARQSGDLPTSPGRGPGSWL